MVRPVHVEEHASPGREDVALPLEALADARAEERRERIEATHLLDEGLELDVAAGPHDARALAVRVQGMRGEGDVGRDGDDRPEDVDELDGGDRRIEELAMLVAMRRDHVRRAALFRAEVALRTRSTIERIHRSVRRRAHRARR